MILEPIFFERNRVGRVYTGGKLFAGFFGDEPMDNFEPEEWMASAVKAVNRVQKCEKEGVSKLKNCDIYFDELLKKYPQELLGKEGKLRILVKALDSAIRLPAQAHPDKVFSKKYFNSTYGKTECWIILDTREDAKLFFGFREGVTKEEFEKTVDLSLENKDAFEGIMKSITPKKGEVYLVPAKTVHAIGKGCLILEIQEPTDFTIQPEHYCGDYKLTEKEMYMGLKREEALECFDITISKEPKIVAETVLSENGRMVERLISEKNTDCFIINRITLTSGEYSLNIKESYGIYILTDGKGEITGAGYRKEIKKGDYFFMPHSLMGKFAINGNCQIIECY